jgi:hypothetical protein
MMGLMRGVGGLKLLGQGPSSIECLVIWDLSYSSEGGRGAAPTSQLQPATDDEHHALMKTSPLTPLDGDNPKEAPSKKPREKGMSHRAPVIHPD